jgi:Hexokinase
MSHHGKPADFLAEYEFVPMPVDALTTSLFYDMEDGLAAEPDGSPDSASEPMIVAPGTIPDICPAGRKVIVIDAGGTNFRSSVVTFTQDGKLEISGLRKTVMPASDKELTKEEFYDAIAANLDYLKDASPRIGFCFSYAVKLTGDGDGKILFFSKEIKAPQAVGTYVGQSLSEALVKRGWKKPEKITILNDTMAALLAGPVSRAHGQRFSSYIGFILGTGMNNAYVEYAPIKKISADGQDRHIVICECGLYSKLKQSAFDREADSVSAKPGTALLEKMCSGAYIGKIAAIMIRHGCEDSLFSKKFADRFKACSRITPADIDAFLDAPFAQDTVLGSCLTEGADEDRNILYQLLDTLLERSSRIVSAVLSASVLKSGRGTVPSEPVCIVCNGTTFWRSHDLYNKIQYHLRDTLTNTYNRYYYICKIENDITLGTALAGLL